MNPFARFSVWLAYFLNSSSKYRIVKHYFYRLFNDDRFAQKKYFDYFMISLVLASVVILVRDVKHDVPETLTYFNSYVISIIFFIEYILRLWVYSDSRKIIIENYEKDLFLQRKFLFYPTLKKIVAKKWEFIRSPQAIVDLLAVMPFFHEFRILRIFVLFRVFKIFRYTKRIQNMLSILKSKKFELLTLMMFSSALIFISTVLIYIIEAKNPHTQIETLYDAFYWTIVTISTVGFGDVVPVSDAGRMVAIITILLSVAVISFATSIIISAFTQKLDEIRENDNIEKSIQMKDLHLICGWSKVSLITAKKLKRKSKNFVILDKDRESVEAAQKMGFLAFWLDPAKSHSYNKLEIDFQNRVAAVLCLYDDDVQNIYVALTIRVINSSVKIVSLLESESNRIKMKHVGINQIIYPQHLAGMIAREFAGKPAAFEVVHAIRSEHEGATVEELMVDDFMLSRFDTIASLEHKRHHLLLLGIQKKDRFIFNPGGEQDLEKGDILIMLGENSIFKEFDNFVHSRRRS